MGVAEVMKKTIREQEEVEGKVEAKRQAILGMVKHINTAIETVNRNLKQGGHKYKISGLLSEDGKEVQLYLTKTGVRAAFVVADKMIRMRYEPCTGVVDMNIIYPGGSYNDAVKAITKGLLKEGFNEDQIEQLFEGVPENPYGRRLPGQQNDDAAPGPTGQVA